MRLKSRFIVLAVLATLLVSMVPSGAVANPPIAVKIALAAPLSAGATSLGHGMDRGTQLAINDYASALAAAGVSVTETATDDQGSPSVAVVNASTIVADPAIVGVVGHLNSGCSIPASNVYSTVHLAMISPASTKPALTQQGLNNVFRTCATDSGQGGFAADTAERNLRLKTAYVVDDSTPYGKLLSSKFIQRFKADGGKVLGSAHTSDRQTGFSALVKKIKAKNPQVVYYAGIYVAGGLFAKQLKSKLPNVQVVGGDGLFDPTFIHLASSSKASGTLADNIGLPVDEMVGGAAFSQRYAALFPGQQIGFYDAYAYDAASAILKAIIEVADQNGASALSGLNARELVREKVATSDFVGVTGRVRFNSAGDTGNPAFSLYRVKSGAWRECAIVGKPAASAKVKRNTAFSVSGSLVPRFAPGSKSVTLLFYRKGGSTYSLVKSVKATASDSGLFSKYSASVKLSTKGAYYIIAQQQDGSHGLMDSLQTFLIVK